MEGAPHITDHTYTNRNSRILKFQKGGSVDIEPLPPPGFAPKHVLRLKMQNELVAITQIQSLERLVQ